MTYITAQEDALLKTQPHRTKLHLSIYKPPVVLVCQANGEIEKGDYVIPYDEVTEGSHLAVKSGMTMYIGSALGLADKGSIRVRSITADEITVAANSEIEWSDNDFLTVVRFWEIKAVYPRQIDNPDSDDPVDLIYYKDYDIAYTDQNSVLGSFICMGPHHAAFIDDGEALVYYTATGTANLRDQAMTYDWHFEGGTPTGSASSVPGWVSYDTPGHYTTTLNVTTADGCDDISHRHVSIYDRPADGTDIPFLKWELEQLSGDAQQNGYTARIKIRDLVPKSVIRDGALVVIFADDWYGNTKQSIGGNAENRQSIVFTGYIESNTIQWNYRDGFVIFDVVSPTGIMKNNEGFSFAIKSAQDPAALAASDPDYPSAWVLVKNMTPSRAIYHYLRWHSTALMCNDMQYTADDPQLRWYDCNRESMHDAIQRFMESALVGGFSCDRQGKMWTVQEPSSNDYALTESPPDGLQSFHVSNMNWINDPIITERTKPTWSFLEAGGEAYQGPSSGTFNVFLSEAPGNWPKYGGSVHRHQGLALTSQSQLNTLSGNMFAFANSRYPNITMRMAGNYRNLDIAPREYINLTVDAVDTPRNIQFTQKRFNPHNIVWSYDSKKELLIPTVSVRELTNGFSGDTIIIPSIPPTTPEDGGSVDQPPLIVPPLPPATIPPILGTSEYFYARFSEELLTAAITTTLDLDDIQTNCSSITQGGDFVGDSSGFMWMISLFVYTAFELTPFTAYTVNVTFWPCPGKIRGAPLHDTPTGEGLYTRDLLTSHSSPGVNGQFAVRAYSFPVLSFPSTVLVGRISFTSPIISSVAVSAVAVGVKLPLGGVGSCDLPS